MLTGSVNTGVVVADIYLFTTDSPFNQIQFTAYVIQGIPIVPFFGSMGNSSLAHDTTNGSARIAQ